MKTKKTNQANLENFRTIFLQIGIILALSLLLFAFEWKSEVDLNSFILTTLDVETIEISTPITKPKEEEREIAPLVPIEKFIIVENDVVIEDEPLFQDVEFEWDEVIYIEEPDEVDPDKTYLRAEFMPTFQGKDVSAFRNYVAQNIIFPDEAIENGITGKVIVQFVVDKDGTLTDIILLRKSHSGINSEVIRVMENSPKWEPGIQSGKYVKVMFTIAIAFELL